METTMMRVRVPHLERTWLAVRSKVRGRSLNAEILDAIRERMKVEPLQIEVRHGCYPDGTEDFVVAYNLAFDGIFTATDRESALAVAFAKAKELGLPRSAVRLVTETFGDHHKLSETEVDAA